MPAEIWHWCAENNPVWSEIHRAGCDYHSIIAPWGYNAAYACRPSMGEAEDGRLFVSWEQFDSMNVEPTTNFLRAGVWLASSEDNGETWQPGYRLTPENTVSHRFPCVADRMVGLGDTLFAPVLYEADSIAGFYVQSQGAVSCNPAIVQWVPVGANGIQTEKPASRAAGCRVWPNPASGWLHIAGGQRYALFDAAGRRVLELGPGANDIRQLGAGVYVLQGEGERRKVVVRR
jgi:hypothetical protein